jgi:glucan phosphoethanolaminetransferase (alkaline phosphatase superfamily)
MQNNRKSFIALALGAASGLAAWAQNLKFFGVEINSLGKNGLLCIFCISLIYACVAFVYQKKQYAFRGRDVPRGTAFLTAHR